MAGVEVKVGQVWRQDIGGHRMAIVGVEDGFAYMKRADSPKKALKVVRGAYPAALGEFERGEWVLLSADVTTKEVRDGR